MKRDIHNNKQDRGNKPRDAQDCLDEVLALFSEGIKEMFPQDWNAWLNMSDGDDRKEVGRRNCKWKE